VVWQGGQDQGGEGTPKETVAVGEGPGPLVGTARGEKPHETTLLDALLPGEIVETFKYLEDGRERDGKRRVLKVALAPDVTMEFVRIPTGSFLMGAPEGEKEAAEDEKPQRRVEFSRAFYLGKYEVTQAEYRAITGDSPSHFKGDLLPVENVSWDDAVAFCDKMTTKTGRKVALPTEAQWEYACRAGTTTPFHFGPELTGQLANCNGNFPYGTNAKGKYRETTVEGNTFLANRWGLYNMHGNVYEWCQDYYGPYDKLSNEQNPVQLSIQHGDHRVLRGGCWRFEAHFCRAANRDWNLPTFRLNILGFRVCLPLD